MADNERFRVVRHLSAPAEALSLRRRLITRARPSATPDSVGSSSGGHGQQKMIVLIAAPEHYHDLHDSAGLQLVLP